MLAVPLVNMIIFWEHTRAIYNFVGSAEIMRVFMPAGKEHPV
jgi:hypothetical protein